MPDTKNGFIQIACGNEDNDILTALMGLRLSGGELSIVLCVIRKTWGWKKKFDWISLSEFERLTNLDRTTVIRAIKKLELKSILKIDRSDENKTSYSFNKCFLEWASGVDATSGVSATSGVDAQQLVALTHTASGVDATHKRNYTKDNITKERQSLKRLPNNNDIERINIQSICDDYQVPESFVLSK